MSEDTFAELADEKFLETNMEYQIDEKLQQLDALRAENKKWELVHAKAIKGNMDTARIAKVAKKIDSILAEIVEGEKWMSMHGSEYRRDQEIDELEHQIDQLEMERVSIDSKLSLYTARLGKLRPESTHPSLGGRVVNGKFVEDADTDDTEDLAVMIAARRRQAQADGHYNCSQVRIKNPLPTRDSNVGF